jgi:serine/threonine-protein kinase
MSLSSGTRLGPYEILGAIGAGGMGEVYKAKDTRLDRIVAVKTLPPHIAAAPDLRERFEREARAISQLSHANICTLYDVGEEVTSPQPPATSHQPPETIRFLVLEYLEGETLAARIAKGPIPVEQALPWAIQMASALNAAHRQGILHRDLKPGNVMLTPAGVKLLDFGLAKIVAGAATASTPAASLMTSPATMTTPLTMQGTILGTFQYMAPEMVEGDEADARADIWAFGCILYEMLTGRRAFVGKSQASLFGAILKEDAPSVSTAQPLVHPALDRIVRTCLAKDPNQRVQSAHDLLLNLQWVVEGGSALGTPAPVLARRKSRERAMWMGVALAVGALGAVAAWFAKPAPAQTAVVTRFVHTLGAGQQFTRTGRHTVAIAPDGTFFVFVANGQLFIRRMNEVEAQPIKGTEEDPVDPIVSPDSQWVAYFVPVTGAAATAAAGGRGRGAAPGGQAGQVARGGQQDAATATPAPQLTPATLKKIPVTGGTSVVLASLGFPFGVSWQDDVIAIGQGAGGVVSVPAGGGTPKELVTLQADEALAASPQLLNHGADLLFSITKKTTSNWNLADVIVQSSSGARHVVVQGGHDARVLPSGHLLYMRDATLFGGRFDLKRLERKGDAVPLIVGVTAVTSTQGPGPGQFGVSAEGRLLYQPSVGATSVKRTLVWVDRQGREQPISAEPREYIYPRVSPSGRKIALDVGVNGTRDIWMWDLEHDILSRLTSEDDRSDKRSPIWAADDRSIFYSSTSSGSAQILRRAADGTGSSEKLSEESGAQVIPSSISPDGRTLITSSNANPRGGAFDLNALALTGNREVKPLIATPKLETNGEISPNGRWLAFESDESGRREIYVRPFPAVDTGRWQISTSGGTRPAWSRNNRELYFVSPDQQMMAVTVESGKDFTYGRPAALFKGNAYYFGVGPTNLNGRTYDVAPDGRFLLIKDPANGPGTTAPTIVIVAHWLDEVKKRLGQ